MFAWVFTTVLLAVAIVGVVRAGIREAGFRRARREGVELQAEVLDNDASPSGNRGQYLLTPVVRYHLEGRDYVGALLNSSGTPGERGTSMTIVVSRDRPYEPYDRYGGMGASARGWIGAFVLAVIAFAAVVATH